MGRNRINLYDKNLISVEVTKSGGHGPFAPLLFLCPCVMTIYSHFSNCSVICCTDALLSDNEKCPVFHDMGIGTIYGVHLYQGHVYTCIDSAAIIMNSLQVLCLKECESC